MAEHCRNEIVFGKRCGRPAKYIVWGKLFKPEQLGPRCGRCAYDQLGSTAMSSLDQYAVYVLPDPDLLTAQRDAELVEGLVEALEGAQDEIERLAEVLGPPDEDIAEERLESTRAALAFCRQAMGRAK